MGRAHEEEPEDGKAAMARAAKGGAEEARLFQHIREMSAMREEWSLKKTPASTRSLAAADLR